MADASNESAYAHALAALLASNGPMSRSVGFGGEGWTASEMRLYCTAHAVGA